MNDALKRALAIGRLAALAGLLAGCGSGEDLPATTPVKGKVTYQGQPVPKGTVTFQPANGRPATGQIQPDGTFVLSTFGDKDGAIPGKHAVMIVSQDGDPTKMPSSPGYVPPKELVPSKYGSIDTSGLETTVTKEKKDGYDFELK